MMMNPRRRSRALTVLVADDSRTVRFALRKLVEGGGHEVVAEAADGAAALQMLREEPVDLVLMDIVMPKMNGIEASAAIMAEMPVPIVVVSELVGEKAEVNFSALQVGAVDVIRKPSAEELANPDFTDRLLRRLETMAEVPVVTRRRATNRGPAAGTIAPNGRPARVDCVCVGASTGGPQLLMRLAGATVDAPWPMCVVQHMADGFADGLVTWLASSGAQVKMAVRGEQLRPGVVYIAPDGRQMGVSEGRVELRRPAPGATWAPSADALFRSAAQASPQTTLGILLTGMGDDGVSGLSALRQAGGWTVAQRPDTCVVPSMPQQAIARGAAAESLTPADIVRLLRTLR